MTFDEANMTIDYLKEIQEGYIEGEGYERHPFPEWYALEKAIQTIEQTTWIPVSERLPKDRREVLVTAYWHETYQVMMGSYYGDGLWWCVPFNNCGEHMQRLKPKAWMPLPAPFEPQEREG